MKKFFYLLLALPLAFAACTEPDTPGVENKEYALNVTSEKIMNFEAEGGQGVITFDLEEVTRFSPVGMPVVEAFCEAAWVTDLAVAENITFNVAANEGDVRETKVVVTYGEQKVEVAVKQAAKTQEPDPADGVVFEAEILAGEYYAEYYTPNAGNYYIFLTDNGFDESGMMLPNSTYYQLDLYGEFFEGDNVNGYVSLPAGVYTLDFTDTMVKGTIGYSYSGYINTGSDVEASFQEDRKSTRLNSSHATPSRMPSSA